MIACPSADTSRDVLNVLLCREKGYKTYDGPKRWRWADLARRVRNGSKRLVVVDDDVG